MKALEGKVAAEHRLDLRGRLVQHLCLLARTGAAPGCLKLTDAREGALKTGLRLGSTDSRLNDRERLACLGIPLHLNAATREGLQDHSVCLNVGEGRRLSPGAGDGLNLGRCRVFRLRARTVHRVEALSGKGLHGVDAAALHAVPSLLLVAPVRRLEPRGHAHLGVADHLHLAQLALVLGVLQRNDRLAKRHVLATGAEGTNAALELDDGALGGLPPPHGNVLEPHLLDGPRRLVVALGAHAANLLPPEGLDAGRGALLLGGAQKPAEKVGEAGRGVLLLGEVGGVALGQHHGDPPQGTHARRHQLKVVPLALEQLLASHGPTHRHRLHCHRRLANAGGLEPAVVEAAVASVLAAAEDGGGGADGLQREETRVVVVDQQAQRAAVGEGRGEVEDGNALVVHNAAGADGLDPLEEHVAHLLGAVPLAAVLAVLALPPARLVRREEAPAPPHPRAVAASCDDGGPRRRGVNSRVPPSSATSRGLVHVAIVDYHQW